MYAFNQNIPAHMGVRTREGGEQGEQYQKIVSLLIYMLLARITFHA